MKGSANVLSSLINNTKVQEESSTNALFNTEGVPPTDDGNNTGGPFVTRKEGMEGEPPIRHTALWVAIVLLSFVTGILGLAEGHRRYRAHKSPRVARVRVRSFSNVQEDSL